MAGTIAIGESVTGGGTKSKEDVWEFQGVAGQTLLVILSGATKTVKAGLWMGQSPVPGEGLMECCGGVGKATWGRHTPAAGGTMCISVQDGAAPGTAKVAPYTLQLVDWSWWPDDFEDNPLFDLFPSTC